MSERGTLGYGTQTYDPLNPYLNDLHLTIDGWRAERDDDGWKVETARPKSAKVAESYFFLRVPLTCQFSSQQSVFCLT